MLLRKISYGLSIGDKIFRENINNPMMTAGYNGTGKTSVMQNIILIFQKLLHGEVMPIVVL